MYATEKHIKEVYIEDCMWFQTIGYVGEDIKHLFVTPYSRNSKPKKESKTSTAIETTEQAIDTIFEGI